MPSIRKKENKAGQIFYEIQVSRGRSRSRLTSRWYPPEGWSQKAIDRELAKVAAEFERRCDNGEAISRAEQKEKDLLQKQEAAKIQTLRQYGERVFMPAKAVTISENMVLTIYTRTSCGIASQASPLPTVQILPAFQRS